MTNVIKGIYVEIWFAPFKFHEPDNTTETEGDFKLHLRPTDDPLHNGRQVSVI